MDILAKYTAQEEICDMTPHEIHEELDRFIIGQDHVKKSMAVTLSNHLKRIHDKNSRIRKSNILMIGDSGTGKTLIAQTIANILRLPLAIVDASRRLHPAMSVMTLNCVCNGCFRKHMAIFN